MSETAFILIVDGNFFWAEELATRLRGESHACRTVENAGQALESLHTRRPDVILAEEGSAGAAEDIDLVAELNRLAPDAEVVLLADDHRDQTTPAGPDRSVFATVPRNTPVENLLDIVAAIPTEDQKDGVSIWNNKGALEVSSSGS